MLLHSRRHATQPAVLTPPAPREICGLNGNVSREPGEPSAKPHSYRRYDSLHLHSLSPDHLVRLDFRPVHGTICQSWLLRRELGNRFREYTRPLSLGGHNPTGRYYEIDVETILTTREDGQPVEPISLTRMAAQPSGVITYWLIPTGINATINYFPAAVPAAIRLVG